MEIRTNNKPRFVLDGWHGYYSDSAFSGILIRFVDNDHVIVGQYFC